MTAEHPRPTSRITDALLQAPPTTTSPPAPATPPPAAEHPGRLTPRNALATPARLAATSTAQGAPERPTASVTAPPHPAVPEIPARSTARNAAQDGAERLTARNAAQDGAERLTARNAAQDGAERPTAADTSRPAPPSPPARPAPTASAPPKPPVTPRAASPVVPVRPAPTASAPPEPPVAPARPAPTAAPERPQSPGPQAEPARPGFPPAAGPVASQAVPAPGPAGRAVPPRGVPDGPDARRGYPSARESGGTAVEPLPSRQAPAPARTWASPSEAGDLPEVETTTRLRPIRDVPRTAHPPRPPRPAAHGTPSYGYGLAGALPPETAVETTTRLRPVRERRTGRLLAVTACVVLGVGLIGGALTGIWLASSDPARPAEPAGYTEAKDLWHNVPVDTLFPRTLAGPGAGPGAAGRTWTRIVVAPDTPCSPAVLAKGLLATLTPLGCERVLRATYTDATASSVITVGLVFTRADAGAQRTLGQGGGLAARLGEDVPPALTGPSTVAARFGARQRASWWLSAPADLPVVVTAVSGFADGRAVERPQSADLAMTQGRTDATAQSGLGHEAKGITKRFESLLRKTVAAAVKEKESAR
ncbi:hypothetical protein ACWFR1_09960 [Streptomyces sp. NPDC055103]